MLHLIALATCDLKRPEATSVRMKQLCGPSSSKVSPSKESHPTRESAQTEAAHFSPTTQLSPQSSLDEDKERENEHIIQHRYSYSLTSTTAALVEENDETSKSFPHQDEDQVN